MPASLSRGYRCPIAGFRACRDILLKPMQPLVLITHTKWTEAPRIRHQVARLLAAAGHRVIFLERPEAPWAAERQPHEVEPGITVVPCRQLLHHQLRVVPAMHRLNAAYVVRDLRRAARSVGIADPARIINFAHDYWFLRDVFPSSRITTLIHDDFEAQSRLPFRGHITWSLERTCRMSDRVLAVSTRLQRRLSAWHETELFLPWAVDPYRAPVTGVRRDTLLFWGFVDTALDTDLLRELSRHLTVTRPDWRIMLVGPTQSRRRARVTRPFRDLANISVHEATPLDRLPLDRVMAALLPYRSTPSCNAVTLANKSMQLLARGLPLLISAMPEFVQQPFVIRLDGEGGFEPALAACERGFASLQPSIAAYLGVNDPASRLRQLDVGPG